MNVALPQDDIRRLKREILVRMICAFFGEDFAESVRLIPLDMRPKGSEVPYRCCIYKERAILRDRLIAGLGQAIEDDDERTDLTQYARNALERAEPESKPLTVLEAACKGCVDSRIYVTDLCQGCVARPCQNTCRFGAISVKNGKSHIDPEKCKKCGMCMQVCPYQAIARTIVPCENACPVGAITKDVNGRAHIDFDKCITCGRCLSVCPFGAIHEKSQLIDILKNIKNGKKVVAMFAPALLGQLPGSPEQLHTALKKIGFYKVYEVAQGADITIANEAADFKERMAENAPFMTTSCCAGYNELVKRHIPELKPYVSATHTPAYYTAELVKKNDADAMTVFISPCIAKRREGRDNPNIDFVLSIEELGALFIAMQIDIEAQEPTPYEVESSREARKFALSSGVSDAVKTYAGAESGIQSYVINGLDKQAIRDLKKFAKDGKCPFGNLIEVMCCVNGCIGGGSCLNPAKTAAKRVAENADKNKSVKS